MKIAFLTGAYKNAGDFLIEKRAMSLLKQQIPDSIINKYYRNKISENIDEINQCDYIVFGGGPIYQRELDGYLPLDICIENMAKPIIVLGGGWYGTGSGSRQITNYRFSPKTSEFLKKISGGGRTEL